MALLLVHSKQRTGVSGNVPEVEHSDSVKPEIAVQYRQLVRPTSNIDSVSAFESEHVSEPERRCRWISANRFHQKPLSAIL